MTHPPVALTVTGVEREVDKITHLHGTFHHGKPWRLALVEVAEGIQNGRYTLSVSNGPSRQRLNFGSGVCSEILEKLPQFVIGSKSERPDAEDFSANSRAMRDEHARDESAERVRQQAAAGGSHSPVEAYPAHGAASTAATGDGAECARAYELAVAKEALSWTALRDSLPEHGNAAWELWRSAVEGRDRATRLLINYSLARGPGKFPSEGQFAVR